MDDQDRPQVKTGATGVDELHTVVRRLVTRDGRPCQPERPMKAIRRVLEVLAIDDQPAFDLLVKSTPYWRERLEVGHVPISLDGLVDAVVVCHMLRQYGVLDEAPLGPSFRKMLRPTGEKLWPTMRLVRTRNIWIGYDTGFSEAFVPWASAFAPDFASHLEKHRGDLVVVVPLLEAVPQGQPLLF